MNEAWNEPLAGAAMQELMELEKEVEARAAELSSLLARKAERLAELQQKQADTAEKRAQCDRLLATLQDAEAELQAKTQAMQAREAAFADSRKKLAAEYEALEAARKAGSDAATAAIQENQQALQQEYQRQMTAFTAWLHETQQAFQEKLQAAWKEDLGHQADERRAAEAALHKDIEQARQERMGDIEQQLAAAQQALAEAQAAKEELDRAQEDEREELALRKKKIERRESQLEAEAQQRAEARIGELQARLDQKARAFDELRAAYDEAMAQQNQKEMLELQYGQEPVAVMQNRVQALENVKKSLEGEIHRLSDQASNRIPQETYQELQDRYDELDRMHQELSRTYEEQATSLRELDACKADALRLQQQLDYAGTMNEQLSNQIAGYKETIRRLSDKEGRIAEREERVQSIEEWSDEASRLLRIADDAPVEPVDEMEWLEGIGQDCYDYGFRFPRRILYAFHTALKIADWSTVTVLAGVSGTGKSELPKLYARFGGINFLNVSVQPNWDSQESMLGFFNSIDNKFDATELMHFLARCSRDDMRRSLNIVLLDEMNLSHVEHYFAEFLSKLETRRDCSDEDLPRININIGAGMDAYKLPLVRNILWTGTMNQDETTKSLSDKVLDRGIVIHFPRPKMLFSREESQSLDEFLAGAEPAPLDYRVWADEWVRHENTLTDTQQAELARYKELLEAINEELGTVGRALGHRVWQSVEYYALNYPLVIQAQNEANGDATEAFADAVHQAVEDQIVQKVMPKLRGIDTRGKRGKSCLARIDALLSDAAYGFEALHDDFKMGEELGYGQFTWNSAEYIDADDIAGAPEAADVAEQDDEA